MKKYGFILAPILLFSANTNAHENDYPTMDTVRFVVECMAELGGQNEENLYTCTCRHDVVTGQMPFERYERAVFFKRYSAMPGKRGGLVRDSEEAKHLVAELDEAFKIAEQKCPAVKHLEPTHIDKE